jgi:hypothetical protein
VSISITPSLQKLKTIEKVITYILKKQIAKRKTSSIKSQAQAGAL